MSIPALAGILKRGSADAGAVAALGCASDFAGSKALGNIFGIQPTASLLKTKLCGAGDGGNRCAPGRVRIVKVHQPISSTTIALVTYMILSASSEDSCMPRVLRRQK